MAETINTNVFDAEKKFVDFSGLDYFWGKAKTYIDGVDASMSAKVVTLEEKVGDSTKGLVKDVKSIQEELESLSGGAGSIATQINNAIAALDLSNTYEAKGAAEDALEAAKAYADSLATNYEVAGAAEDALEAAKSYADSLVMTDGVVKFDAAGTAAGLNDAMNDRVVKLEAIDHDKLAADAAAAAVAGVIDGAPEKFDTLKEVAQWIADSESAAIAADLVTRVSTLEAIDHEAYKTADETVLATAKSYADSKVDGKFDAAGTAKTLADEAQAAAIEAAAADATSKANAAQAAAIEAAAADATSKTNAAQAAAIAQAKLDAAEALKSYYTKTEVDNLLSINSEGDRAYAKQYTDELFGSIKFAANSDIDAMFA